MLNFYTIVVIATIISSCVMLALLFRDELLSKKCKTGFTALFIIIVATSIIDLLSINLNENILNNTYIKYLLNVIVLYIASSFGYLYILLTVDNLSNKTKVFIHIFLVINLILPLLSIFTGEIFYYDLNNAYTTGNSFDLYLFYMPISIFFMFYRMNIIIKEFNNKNEYTLIFLCMFVIASLITHYITENKVFWIVLVITLTMFYVFYTLLLSQRDVLTNLSNRRCYENQIYYLRSKSQILSIDLNDFKHLNDTYGHTYGDFCLSIVGKYIDKVYGKYGYCFRIGGDEFTVILTKKLDDVDSLNKELISMLNSFDGDRPLPTLSIGYSYFDPKSSNIHRTIENADKMMYEIKNQSK